MTLVTGRTDMHTFYRHKHTPQVAASWQPPLSRHKQKRRHHCFFCFLPSWSLGPFRVMQTSQNHKCLGALTLFGALRRTTSAFATSNVLGACREIVLTRVRVCIAYWEHGVVHVWYVSNIEHPLDHVHASSRPSGFGTSRVRKFAFHGCCVCRERLEPARPGNE